MDTYDLFGEDVGGSMLDGLPELGSDNFDPATGAPRAGASTEYRQQGGGPQQQSAPQHGYPNMQQQQGDGTLQKSAYMQKQPYGHMDAAMQKQAYMQQQQQQASQAPQQESPLQKLSSFGGDFTAGSNHMDPSSQAMFHQNHSGYGDGGGGRPMSGGAPPAGYVRSMGPQQAANQYPYGMAGAPPTDNMYSMDASQTQAMGELAGWAQQGGPNAAGYRQPQHYQAPSAYRQQQAPHMNYQDPKMSPQGQAQAPQQQQQQQQQQPAYGSQQMMIPPHQSMPSYHQQQAPQTQASNQQAGAQQPGQSYQQGMSYPSPGSAYANYGAMHQASTRMPQAMQYDMGSSQGYNHMQGMGHSGFGPRPMAGEQYAAPAPPKAPQPPQQQQQQQQQPGSSPQYRAPYPQLSPQMSPRPQPAQQMSPRPVMSPAKPSTLSPHPHSTLSPRPKSATPTPSQQSFPQQSTLQQLEQMVMPNAEYQGYGPRGQLGPPQSSPIGPRTPLSPQWPSQGPSQGARPPFNMNGSLGVMENQQAGKSTSNFISVGTEKH